MMIRKELAKDPELANESWDRFLPNYKKRTLSKRRVPHKVTDKTKKVYTPFPPPQEKSKVDLQIESGEYFIGKQARERKAREDREEQQREKRKEKLEARQKEFEAPKEASSEKKKKKHKRKRTDDGEADA